ncbi:MAG: hypothetical protein HKP44_02170 [Desulfofustis sp.]|nr:hypothetical protein [Desulfofustis sp.]
MNLDEGINRDREKAMLETVYSVSDNLDPLAGIRNVVADCREQLGGRKPAAGMFFTSCMEADYVQMLEEILGAFPDIELIGCTTDGEITQDRGFTEDSSALLLLISEEIAFAAGIAENISETPQESVANGYKHALDKLNAEPVLAFVLPDGITTMNLPIEAYLRSEMGQSMPIFGGSAGDGFRIVQTFQFCGEGVYTDAMPLLLLAGDLEVSFNIAIGPVPYGKYYRINKVEGNIVYTIDGVTALEFYERFYGKYIEDRELSFFPLAVYTGDKEDFVLRDSVNIDREKGSISFIGRFEEPCRARLTQVTRDETLNSGHAGSAQVLSAFGDKSPDLILLFSCTSRRHVLGSRTDEEFLVLQQDRQGVPYFGFYCYGEISPFTNDGPVHFHSDTCISVALRSK